ncbi:MAG: hypothetical protein GKR88_13280 [Flavobacteriaceae bacterium]|nr:MAG: hypothetical protein GKR88_13280 [Flavobacteriaceae bacterium]
MFCCISIGIIALIWNGIGVNAYIQQAYQTDSFKATYTEEQLETIYNMPAWATAAFAIAVFGGFLGALLLLLKRKLATPIFILSFVGIIVQMIYNLFIAKAIEVYGPGAIVMLILVVLIGVFLIWYSKKATANGWLS